MSYVRVSILGTLVNIEQWSINPVFDPTGEFPGGVSQAALDTATLAIANRTIPTKMLTFLSLAGTRTGARVEVRDDVTDNLIGISIQQSTTVATGTATARLTVQDAIVASIRTNTPGGSGRGRLYWPAMGITTLSDGRIPQAECATFIADMKSYLTGIQGDLGAAFPAISFNLAVRSKTTKTTPHATRLQAGNVVDTQRRRRDSLPESYSTVNIP